MSDEGFFDVDIDGERFQSAVNINYKIGVDGDLIGGYDFGMFRAEAELGHKRLGIKTIRVGNGNVDPDDFDDDGRASVLSAMGNALLDFGGETGVGAYVGGGLGRARIKFLGDSDNTWAWQAIAGVRAPITPQLDAGLKYRYFNSGRLNFSDDALDDAGAPFTVGTRGRLKTHSLMLSLVYNFAAPPPPPPPAAPPPPPPAAPATQTCADGSVILATDVCPVPPPPPPPPAPEPERG
jgi:opacity protein-like surface antigen